MLSSSELKTYKCSAYQDSDESKTVISSTYSTGVLLRITHQSTHCVMNKSKS